jgi:flagellar assembly protein FliH
VIGVVKEALNALPAAGQNIKLHLHPEDSKLVADTMLANANERKWELVDNPLIQRGGCRIETDSSNVDATIESRVAAIAVRIMGGERANDS